MTVDLTKLFSVGEEVTLLQEYIDTLEESKRKVIMVRNRYGTIINLFSSYMVLEFGSIKITAELKDIFLGNISHLRNYPHILYRMLDCQVEQGNKRSLLPFIDDCYVGKIDGGFTWNRTKEDGLWNFIMDSDWDDDFNLDTIKYNVLNKCLFQTDIIIPTKDSTNINNSFKPNQHEIRLQKPHSVIIRGTVPEGNRVCSRKHQVAVRSRHLSYSACSFRS